ncbi:hypothetical protein ABGB17_22180 [Sphaerisporangium sp. B11E5]|uniref:hypothetical protein n=1 Tax=Sphaerisporangium sp. B11E5 TaxID=3153563 RepID=UPI00325E1D1B
MRNLSKALTAGAFAGTLTVGLLGGAALANRDGGAGVPYELTAADPVAAEAASLAGSSPAFLTAGDRDPADRPRLRLGARRALIGVHGETTVRARGGGFDTFAWQRGAVTSASGTALTVRSADGVSWTWTVTGDSKVRKNGDKSTPSALKAGDDVFVLGRPSGDTRTALGVVVPKR